MTWNSPGEAPARPALPPPPAPGTGARRKRRPGFALGATMVVLGVLAAPPCFVMAFLTANTCGFFSDHCSTYGQTSTASAVFLLATALAIVVAVAGLVVMIVSSFLRSR